jgi:hypothetical protein
MLKRIIMSSAPRYALGPIKEGKDGKPLEDDQRMGCAPYLQLFKAGKLLHTAPASLHFQQAKNELPFCQVADDSISFHIDTIVQGDILIRCRHLTSKKQRVSMFRAAFHTGYVPPQVMRLTKSQLDGACNDDRFPEEFFMDLIFEPVDAELASKVIQEKEETTDDQDAEDGKKTHASPYDTMLNRDSRFWDVITEHKKGEKASADRFCGPTVGRRRDFNKKGENGCDEAKTHQANKEKEQKAALETFSIGGEMDFLPEGGVQPEEAAPKITDHATKKDSLMEALMGALDDEDGEEDDGVEEIVFQTPSLEKSVEEIASTSPVVSSTSVVQPTKETGIDPTNCAPDMEALLADADLDIDMDALDLDTGGDEDIDDLENFLSPTNK